jgi:hypothetical protein
LEKYSAQVVEVCENGDAIVQLPDDLIEELGWKVDDVLTMTMVDGAVHVKNITKHPELFKD